MGARVLSILSPQNDANGKSSKNQTIRLVVFHLGYLTCYSSRNCQKAGNLWCENSIEVKKWHWRWTCQKLRWFVILVLTENCSFKITVHVTNVNPGLKVDWRLFIADYIQVLCSKKWWKVRTTIGFGLHQINQNNLLKQSESCQIPF